MTYYVRKIPHKAQRCMEELLWLGQLNAKKILCYDFPKTNSRDILVYSASRSFTLKMLRKYNFNINIIWAPQLLQPYIEEKSQTKHDHYFFSWNKYKEDTFHIFKIIFITLWHSNI